MVLLDRLNPKELEYLKNPGQDSVTAGFFSESLCLLDLSASLVPVVIASLPSPAKS